LRRASLAYVVLFVGIAANAPYLTLYLQSLGIPLGSIGALVAFTGATALISGPAWGVVHDRFPRSFVLLPLAGALAALGCYGLFRLGSTPFLPLFAVVFSVGMSGLFPMIDVRVLELAASDRTRYGLVRAWGSATFIVFAPLVGLLATSQGYGVIFLVLIPTMLAGSLIATTVPGRSNVHRAPSMLRAPGRVLSHRPIAIFMLGSLVCWTAIYSQTGFFSIYLKSLGAPADQVGWAWSIAAILEVPIMLSYPILARRVGVERLILLGVGIAVARQIANVVFTEPSILLACSILQGAGFALLLVGGVTFVSRQAPRGTAATAQGLLSAVAVLASIIGSGVGGQVAGILTIRGLYVISVGLGLLGVVMIAAAVLPGAIRGRRPETEIPPEALAAAIEVGGAVGPAMEPVDEA
jgi:PPP family 3-phenylpropionic acid transporter